MTNLSFRIFLFILAFAPLAFASVEHWSLMTVEILSSITFLCMLVGLRRDSLPFLSVPGLVPLLLILGFMLIQLLPLPVLLIKLISPTNWEVYRLVYEQGGSHGWLPLSVNQKETLQEFLRLASYGVFYFLVIQVLRSGTRVKQTLKFVALLAGIIAFLAILQQFTAEEKIFWIRPAPSTRTGGPWVNINQYAAFIASISPLVLGLYLFYRPRAYEQLSIREQFVLWFSSPNSGLCLLFGVGAILMIVSLFISLCRGGIVTIILSMLLFMLLVAYKRRSFRHVTLWACLCVALLSVTWFGWQPIFERFGATFDAYGLVSDGRLIVWSDTIKIVKDFPLLGAGFGSFNDIYPSYKTIPVDKVVEHAHNDYLELLTDGGGIAFVLAAWFCLTVLLHGWKKISQRGDRFAVLLGVASFTAVCALLMHSVFDFNLHNGAVGLYFFFLCGLLVATVNTRYDTHRAESSLVVMPKSTGLISGTVVLLLLAATSVVQIGILNGRNSYSSVKDIYVSSYLLPEIAGTVGAHVKKAQTYDPLEGLYPYYLGNLSAVRQNREAALAYYLQAARKQPLEGIYLQRIGMMLHSGSAEAREFMQEGYRRSRNKHEVAYDWVEWLLLNGERDLAVTVLKERLDADHAQAAKIVVIMEAHGFSRSEITAILPAAVEPWLLFGIYMERVGRIDEASYYFDKAAGLAEDEPALKPHLFSTIISFYSRHKLPETALSLLRLAVKTHPQSAHFHLLLGDHYFNEGITYRAKEEYTRAVMIDPVNETYRKRLERLEEQLNTGVK